MSVVGTLQWKKDALNSKYSMARGSDSQRAGSGSREQTGYRGAGCGPRKQAGGPGSRLEVQKAGWGSEE